SPNPLSTLLQRFACARLSRPYRAGVISPTLPQRSPPSLLATAACGGLRSAPDCRTRRALPHLLYSCASPFGQALLVTQDPCATWWVRISAAQIDYRRFRFGDRNLLFDVLSWKRHDPARSCTGRSPHSPADHFHGTVSNVRGTLPSRKIQFIAKKISNLSASLRHQVKCHRCRHPDGAPGVCAHFAIA